MRLVRGGDRVPISQESLNFTRKRVCQQTPGKTQKKRIGSHGGETHGRVVAGGGWHGGVGGSWYVEGEMGGEGSVGVTEKSWNFEHQMENNYLSWAVSKHQKM